MPPPPPTLAEEAKAAPVAVPDSRRYASASSSEQGRASGEDSSGRVLRWAEGGKADALEGIKDWDFPLQEGGAAGLSGRPQGRWGQRFLEVSIYQSQVKAEGVLTR